MKKRFLTLAAAALMAAAALATGRAKYVFYFIGDGMGVNQVNGTETYLAALEGRIGVVPLCFTQFPAVGYVTTFSGTNGVTDSAAAGTALSSGKKTHNGTLGMLADLKTNVPSVAEWAKAAGAAVGVSTTVSVDHATPAAFYAHVPDRGMYYEIGRQMIAAGYDFYAGSDFLEPVGPDSAQAGTLYEQCARAGYTVVRGYPEFQRKAAGAGRVVLFQPEEASRRDRTAVPYAIDRTADDLTLQDIARAGISQLTAAGKDGFFFMLEGGKVDWACHSNDAATAFREVVDLDNAVRVAYEFYRQHPDETLIVITADHETGGIALGRGPYELHTELLGCQKMSAEAYTAHLKELQRAGADAFTWDAVRQDLQENWGFWDRVKLTDKQTARLKAAFDRLSGGQAATVKGHYASLSALANTARDVMAEAALIGWQSGEHSNGYVPVFAIGAGAEKFAAKLDNTQIPLRIAEAAGWEH